MVRVSIAAAATATTCRTNCNRNFIFWIIINLSTMVTTESVLLSWPMSVVRVEWKWNEKEKLGAWIHSHWKWTSNNKILPYECDFLLFSYGTVKIQMHTHSGGKGDVVPPENWERKNAQFIKLNQSNFERNGLWSSFFLHSFFAVALFAAAQPSQRVLSLYELRSKCTAPEIRRTDQQRTQPCEQSRCECEVVPCDSLYNRFIFQIHSAVRYATPKI